MNRANFLNREIIFGTYFLGEWIEQSGKETMEEVIMLLTKNPFKYIPEFLLTAINTSAELNGLDKVTLLEVIEEIDNVGGVSSKKVQEILEIFTATITANLGNEKKPARAKK
jgi:hypothetical protein